MSSAKVQPFFLIKRRSLLDLCLFYDVQRCSFNVYRTRCAVPASFASFGAFAELSIRPRHSQPPSSAACCVPSPSDPRRGPARATPRPSGGTPTPTPSGALLCWLSVTIWRAKVAHRRRPAAPGGLAGANALTGVLSSPNLARCRGRRAIPEGAPPPTYGRIQPGVERGVAGAARALAGRVDRKRHALKPLWISPYGA